MRGDCRQHLFGRGNGRNPMDFSNDNVYVFGLDIVYRWRLRFIEVAVYVPLWTTMIVYYIQEDRGHFTSEALHRAQHARAARGDACQFSPAIGRRCRWFGPCVRCGHGASVAASPRGLSTYRAGPSPGKLGGPRAALAPINLALARGIEVALCVDRTEAPGL